MSLNNWLCKHFDDEKKGYVNIADIVLYPFRILLEILEFIGVSVLFWSVFILFAIGICSAGLQGWITEDYPATTIDLFVIIIKGLILPTEIVLFLIMVYKPLKYLFGIKVAKCPPKETEESR